MIDGRRRVRWRWVGLGLLLLQLGWVAALPPFGAMDEWDHAYRASAVAHGQWVAPPSDATRGTGAFVSVPTDIVRAAQDECERLRYGGADECIGTTEGDLTEVASGAGRYPPLFYALVGWPSLFLDGAGALYGMRLVGLLLCGALLLASFRSLARWAHPVVGLTMVLGLTPSVMYAGAAVAPNGLEMVSGVALWAALATIAHDHQERALDGLTVMLAVVAGSLLLSLRSLGPLWVGLILGVALVAWPALWSRLLTLARSRLGVAALSWLIAVSIGSVWWIRTQGSLEVGSSDAGTVGLARRLQVSLRETVVWTFQFMGAFPYRNNPSRPLVYLFLLIVIVTLLVLAFRRGTRRERWALTTTIALSYAIPFAISVATIERFGTAWQGRYALPFLLGALVIAGVILGRSATAPKPWVLCVGAALVAAAHTIATVHVLGLEHKLFERTSTPPWPLDVHPALLASVVLSGAVLLSVPFVTSALHRSRP
jgi:hypothetical protein